ncbi:hypothetical protein [Candidatus Amarobacter glycogenicus]|uniref:hypothetical protein n=1 Tax=Candidatus Amarobacter glycogenicus TaxID=3140699 RepID=UPI002A178761|nr:hypothetical protein [Dehalococcoidia bacterium]
MLVCKHAVVCLTEGLYKNFKTLNLKLSASVLCPGWVNTNIADAGRNRPAELGEVTDPASLPAAVQAGLVAMRGMLQNGYQPSEIAQHVLDAIMTDTFFIIPAQSTSRKPSRPSDQVLKRENPTTGLF